jgi:NAD(P)-dependent dehydrogenase (short-subunit alcohol dehydrogenase family)
MFVGGVDRVRLSNSPGMVMHADRRADAGAGAAGRITRNQAALRASVAMHPIGRIGAPDDIARAIESLLSPSSEWITGQVLAFGGGLSNVRTR